MIYNIHNENGLKTVSATYMYVQCRYLTNNPHHVVLVNKISLKDHKLSFKFRAITNLSCVPLNPWLVARINIQKSNLYCNGFIFKQLNYWSMHTHNRPGWRPKSFSYTSLKCSRPSTHGACVKCVVTIQAP